MFGRATIRLGIGPHSSCVIFQYYCESCHENYLALDFINVKYYGLA